MALTLRNWRLALIPALVLAAAPAYAQEAAPANAPGPGPGQQEGRITASDLDAALNAELFYELLVGEMAAAQGDIGNAVALFMDAARQSRSSLLYQRAAELALQSRSGQRALIVANEWHKAFPQSRDANRYVLQILLMLNRVSETQEYLNREVAWTSTPAKPAKYLAIAQLYSRASDKALAAAVVEQALQPDLKDPELEPSAWATIGHLRLAANQKDLALQALEHAYVAAPRHGATALLALELLEAGSLSAEPMVQDYMQDQPVPTIHIAYVRVLMGLQRWDDAQKQLTALLQAQPDMADAWMTQASLHAQRAEWPQAQQALQRLEALLLQIQTETTRAHALTQAYVLAGRIALQQKDAALALSWLDKVPEANRTLTVQSLRAAALARQGKLTQGRALIRTTPVDGQEQEMQKQQAEIALLRDNGAPQEAYRLQRTLYERHPQNADIAYETAILAERAGQLEMMEKILQDIIARHPDHHHAYNALGYSWADRGIRLAQARQLIETALSYAPDDPFITDSLGWLEFRLGKHAKALALLEKAYALRDDVEIAAHLGEVLWAMGQHDRARDIWRAALQRDADNETLQSTLKRLQVKL